MALGGIPSPAFMALPPGAATRPHLLHTQRPTLSIRSMPALASAVLEARKCHVSQLGLGNRR